MTVLFVLVLTALFVVFVMSGVRYDGPTRYNQIRGGGYDDPEPRVLYGGTWQLVAYSTEGAIETFIWERAS